jgi:DNA-binding NarL/FixJ family response regulator
MNTSVLQARSSPGLPDASDYVTPALGGPMTQSGAGQGELVWIVSPHGAEHQVLRPLMERAGYSVESISSGVQALAQAASQAPDLLLLDGQLQDVDSLAMARHWQGLASATHCPVIFLADSAQPTQLVQALQVGCADVVHKPVRPHELLARSAMHLAGARERRQTRNALDAFGYATMTVRPSDGRLMWQTALSRELLARYCPVHPPYASRTAPQVQEWLQACMRALERGEAPRHLTLYQDKGARLVLRLHQQTGDHASDGVKEDLLDADDWLIVMRELSDHAVMQAMSAAFTLTAREAEVLYWVVKGKTNKDIGDILGGSPMTVKKHLERVFVKLGVETRTAAAGKATARIPQLQQQVGA